MKTAIDILEPALAPIATALRRWYFARLEQHYLMSADIEAQRAREAHAHAAYYQKRAAFARSNKH